MDNPMAVIKKIVVALWEFLVLLLLTCYWYCEAIFRLFVRPPLKSLEGEVILVTGSAKGIGREVCILLAEMNAKIVCWDLDQEANEDLVSQLKKIGCEAYSFKVDVSDRSQVESIAREVKERVGDVTVLINNAGIMPCKQFLSQTPDEIVKAFEVNVFAHFWALREFLPQMISMNKGHIVTVCSAAGLISIRNLAPYCGTKFAVHGFIEALKDELRHFPKKPAIQFTTVYPFSCNTGMLSGVRSYSRFPWLMSPVLEPEEVAQKLVDGLRRNYDHVYVPELVNFAGTTAKALLPKVQYAAMDFARCYVEPTK